MNSCWTRVSRSLALGETRDAEVVRFAGLSVGSLLVATHRAKGKPAKIPVPGSGTDSPLGCEPQVAMWKRLLPVRRGNATGHGDAGGGLGKSYLFSRSGRGPGNLSEGDRVLALCEERRQHGAASGELLSGP